MLSSQSHTFFDWSVLNVNQIVGTGTVLSKKEDSFTNLLKTIIFFYLLHKPELSKWGGGTPKHKQYLI